MITARINRPFSLTPHGLYERYSIHLDAEQQGVYLILWFGPDEKVAGLKKHQIKNAQAFKKSILAEMPTELAVLVDVFVLDVSMTQI